MLLGGAALAFTAATLPARKLLAASPDTPVIIEARPGKALLLDGGKETSIWGYGGQVPGPLLRVKRGEQVWFQLKNSLPDPTTIHWHGIRIDNAMDGVAHLTQHAVEPGGTFDYRFTVPDAGTFWYHPHHVSWEQVARGLYGALIVEEDEAPSVDRDIVLIGDDWRLDDASEIDEKSFNSLHDRAHAGRLGNVLTVNGKPLGRFEVKSGELVRLRLLNTCNSRILSLEFEGLKPTIIALDGQPCTHIPLADGKLRIAPAQRADLLIEMTGEPGSTSAISEISRERLVAAEFVYQTDGRVDSKGRSALVLPDNGISVPDLVQAMHVDLVMAGGAMGQLTQASYDGKQYAMRDLAQQHGMIWALNGQAGMSEKPLFTARRGQTVVVRMVNESLWPHAMHFHGHHFRQTENPPGPWHDTILLERTETKEIAFVADNPGKWMIHCHMLEHQAGGMDTWFEVLA
ncbi:MAG: multicopper oxidase family protein [Hyphomicrobiales bacterium]